MSACRVMCGGVEWPYCVVVAETRRRSSEERLRIATSINSSAATPAECETSEAEAELIKSRAASYRERLADSARTIRRARRLAAQDRHDEDVKGARAALAMGQRYSWRYR
jgi:hypothetical protein